MKKKILLLGTFIGFELINRLEAFVGGTPHVSPDDLKHDENMAVGVQVDWIPQAKSLLEIQTVAAELMIAALKHDVTHVYIHGDFSVHTHSNYIPFIYWVQKYADINDMQMVWVDANSEVQTMKPFIEAGTASDN